MSNLKRKPQQELPLSDPNCLVYSPHVIEDWAGTIDFWPQHNDKYAGYFLNLVSKYCLDKDDTPYGPPELWLRNVISYCFFFGLGLTLSDREYARLVLYGLPEEWSRYALFWLSQVKKAHHEDNVELWGHSINLVTLFINHTCPKETDPSYDVKALVEKGRSIGFVTGVRLALDNQEFAESLFEGAVDEREKCDDKALKGRVGWIAGTIEDFWNKDKARSSN